MVSWRPVFCEGLFLKLSSLSAIMLTLGGSGAWVEPGWWVGGGGRGSNSQILKPVPETLIPVYSPRSLRVLGGSLGCAGPFEIKLGPVGSFKKHPSSASKLSIQAQSWAQCNHNSNKYKPQYIGWLCHSLYNGRPFFYSNIVSAQSRSCRCIGLALGSKFDSRLQSARLPLIR